ncbi:MAG: phosphotransferase, partial [Candidatus Limnocylindrales bacterium]
WQDARPVVEAAREAFGLEAVILRLLHADLPRPQGGHVSYLAEIREPLPEAARGLLTPWTEPLTDDPRRLRWATAGGTGADLRWASGVLRARGLERIGPAEQVRTWNLSSIWRLPLRDGSAWLKVVPPFFAHEGDILRRLQGGSVPRLLGHDRDRILLAEVPGDDHYDAELPELLEMVSRLVELQATLMGRTDELLGIGLPDWRGSALTLALAAILERRRGELAPDDRRVLEAFVGDLPGCFAAIEACGIADTLVHGDFHPGNVRGEAGSLVLLDWGDCGVGQPMLDMSGFLDRVPPGAVVRVRDHWRTAWRTAVPGSDPDRAAALLAPVAAARQAVIYQVFLDGIEPSEQPYHRDDPPEWLGRAAALIRAGASVVRSS